MLPRRFRESPERCRRGAVLEGAEEDGDPRNEDQGAADEPQHGHTPGDKAGLIHQIAEQQPVSEPGTEARPE